MIKTKKGIDPGMCAAGFPRRLNMRTDSRMRAPRKHQQGEVEGKQAER